MERHVFKTGKKIGILDNPFLKASTITLSVKPWKGPVQKYCSNNTTVLGISTIHSPTYFWINTQRNKQSAYASKGAVLPLPLAEHVDCTRYECPRTQIHLVTVKLSRTERHQCQESLMENNIDTEHLLFCMQVLWHRNEISSAAKDTNAQGH